MSRKYPNAGLTENLYRRLVNEYNALRVKYGREFNGRIRAVRNCDVREARKYSQKFCNVIHERSRLSPNAAEDLKGLISDQLFSDLQAYLAENYRGKKAYQKHVSFDNAGLPDDLFKRFQEEVEELRKEHPNDLNKYIREVKCCNQKEANKTQNALNQCYLEKAALTPLKAIQMEGLLSRGLFSEIIDYVFNNYEWSERLDDEVDRITLEYRTKGDLGRNKASVKRALYTAYALGV